MALKDNRLNLYKDSLLAVVQTNVCNGPVYFNSFPDYTVALSDPLIQESLILDLHVSGNKFKEFAKKFAIVFRIYFRLMSSTVNPKFIHEPSSKEETIFIEVHAKDNKTRSLVTTARTLPWDKITIPEVLMIPKEPPTPNMIKQDIEEIEEDDKRFKDEICETWYKDMKKLSINFPFFIWFDLYCQRMDIIDPYDFSSIHVQSQLAKNWNLKDGRTVTSVHPPPAAFKFPQGNKEIEAAPYKTGCTHQASDPVVVDDIIKVYQQNNYSNQILQTIASQVDHVSTKLDAAKTQVSEPSKAVIQKPFNTLSQPHFKPQNLPYSITSKLVKETGSSSSSSSSSSTDLLQKISTSLSQLASKNVNVITKPTDSESDSIESSYGSDDGISQIKEQFDDYQEVNRIKNRKSWQNVSTRNYYPRPKPPDIQYEERSKFKTSQFSPNVIHEWNIDGKSEYEILNTLQEMGMAKSAYELRESNQQVIFTIIIAGFTGQLRNWWGNSLTLETQLEIFNHKTVQINDSGMEVEVNDCCDYLIVVIAMYFVGNPKEELSSQKIILTNLRCPTLSDYRWYKDTFLTYVLRRPDCNEGFWMEKFISTFQNFSLKYNSEKRQSRRELGCFREAFGLEKLDPSSFKAKRQTKRFHKKRFNPSKSKYQSSPLKYYQKRRSRKYPKKQSQNKEIICFKCGKPGHKADKCFTKKKINELFQDNPDMCQNLSKLFLKSSSDEESNDDINIIQESSDDESYDSASSSPILRVNVISDEDDKTFLFDLIDKVDDPDIKRDALLRLKSLVIQEHTLSKTVPSTEPFSISKLFNNYPANTIKGKSLELSSSPLKQLQQELNSLKAQVNDLHNQLQNIHVNEFELDRRLSAL
ncbi:hypothetical protein RND81_02G024400 [Saponaria officinalis]|uniref:CCHC-type domain-containing protein n=1 Tax=Saponaria officinalis TaxID=3572 RepID=A0AAW1MMP8_SAPOF